MEIITSRQPPLCVQIRKLSSSAVARSEAELFLCDNPKLLGEAAIAIGSEGRGLSAALLALCDKTIRIPMNERCESLNAAAAATVLLWECARND